MLCGLFLKGDFFLGELFFEGVADFLEEDFLAGGFFRFFLLLLLHSGEEFFDHDEDSEGEDDESDEVIDELTVANDRGSRFFGGSVGIILGVTQVDVLVGKINAS